MLKVKKSKSQATCKSCKQVGHATKNHSACPDNPKNNKEIFDGKKLGKKLIKEEKIKDAIVENGDDQKINTAEEELKNLQENLKKLQDDMKKQIADAQNKVKAEEEIAKAGLMKKWEEENKISLEKWESDYQLHLEKLNLADTPDLKKLYQSFRDHKPPAKSWEKKQRKKGKGGGGGKIKEKSKCECQARLFYSYKGDYVRADYCGKTKEEGTDFCKKHKKKQKEGVMDDGIRPSSFSDEKYEKLINHAKYGEENKIQFGCH